MAYNPYTLVFGKEPNQMISRSTQMEMIYTSFTEEHPSQQIFMISGVRGSGKTVFMTDISKRLENEDNWIVTELNPNRDMLTSLVSKLSSEDGLSGIIKGAEINLSLFGFGITFNNSTAIQDVETALIKILESLKKHGKKLLVTIDEVSNNQYMREFASAYQILIRHDLPVFLLMTGLYENINELQNDKTLTFLYRAPKIYLQPLNIMSMADNYHKVLSIEKNTALKMAKLTKGYPFAFQVMGYFTWDKGGDFNKALEDYKVYLFEYSYDKIWSSLSENDRKICQAIAGSETGKIKEIRESIDYSSNQFNPYRNRLIKKGLISGERRGFVEFTLPAFDEFVYQNTYMDE